MSLEIRREESALVIHARGPMLGLAAAEDFRDEVLDLVAAGNRRLVIDLGEIAAIDSEGLGALVLVLKQVVADGALALCNVREVPRSVLRITRLDRVLAVYPGEAEALAAIAA